MRRELSIRSPESGVWRLVYSFISPRFSFDFSKWREGGWIPTTRDMKTAAAVGKGNAEMRKQGSKKAVRGCQTLGFESFGEFPLSSSHRAYSQKVSLMAWAPLGVPGTLNAQGLGCVIVILSCWTALWCCLFVGLRPWVADFFPDMGFYVKGVFVGRNI
jgi:hypothetical protein